MKKVLIVTHSGENACFEQVADAVIKLGGHPVRLNTDLYPEKIGLSCEFDGDQWIHTMIDEAGEKHNLHEFESIWYRRFYCAHSLWNCLDEKYVQPAIEESRRTLIGFLEAFEGFVLDRYSTVRNAEVKMRQLRIANEVGLLIPKTSFTNEPSCAIQFSKKSKTGAILKMQASFAIYEDGIENVVFTNEVDKDESFENIELCPMQLQDKIEKQVELRATVVGNKVFTASIDSQSMKNAELDWRRKGIELGNDWIPYELPKDVEKKLIKYMDIMGLNYGAADFIVTPEGDHYFLEVNPVGEFFWLQLNPGLPIAEALAEMLLGNSPRRE